MTKYCRDIALSFEFFPPKNADAASQLWDTVDDLKKWQPEFVSVTYGAGGTTRDTTLGAVSTILSQHGLDAASHLTCVGSSRDEVRQVVADLKRAGVRRIVALRGDPQGGLGNAYVPHPEGYAYASDLVAGLADIGGLDISVSAYPERHPESRDWAAEIDNLKRKADAGAARALTQFFFDNDLYERYVDKALAAGVTIPIVPGILPIPNLTQVQRFAGMCGASVPDFVEQTLGSVEDHPEERFRRAAELAATQVLDLIRRGVDQFHVYTMNRSALTSEVLRLSGFEPARFETPALTIAA
ncbi:methylenetetrahydrofolate reductase (NADPH) [Rhizobium sp. SG_E_25_P2]|uniref:methylenetetrahydrofolate reductase [NAD(P)H] n=1 Tax=Rhizobium sp. SG_E_25_P2 TaxID=2879942 RepID=UPI002473DA5F|nr:methylenetetrahydrofolate reductase [NAD(P)H] [Rhizobium sp. SG_E_25_P2]MDH6269219.1 methylenetetrahydrofolate reductase (NADPH) [Rhizobium sp. SG_E_25_P2]